ncbi:NADPH:quinone reductase or related Zn-dependent oxidoreductase (Qor) [Fructobacillus tropaeoli]|uniref:zinc-binding alcohol dehydrogenase family protein n=1 Tax=Fructobacillus tropaeoli TaxID=709323 RepID=UPI002D815E8C|nr:NADPH:quinone reductase or related Zn-dependent oxidoreductase (Qor) [Fructobacillus tropaeoli]
MSLKTVFQKVTNYFQPKMIAIGITHNGSLEAADAFVERQVRKPTPDDREVLVRILATAVNPVDTKMRAGYRQDGVFRVFGLDVVGVIEEVGKDVTDFSVGDRVFYAGKQHAFGADTEFQVIEADMIALAPKNLDNVDAAAMPLTSITAHDVLHHGFHLPVAQNSAQGKSVLIINGAGGVGSVLVQMAKYLGLTVIATAGTTESKNWVRELGADFVLDYHEDLQKQLAAIHFPQVDYIANLQDTTAYWDLMTAVIKPYGEIAAIVETTLPVDLGDLKSKAASFSWTFMLARGNENFNLAEQGQILRDVANLLDQGVIRPTVTKVYQGLSVENVRHANQDVTSHHTMGKVVIDYMAEEEANNKVEQTVANNVAPVEVTMADANN